MTNFQILLIANYVLCLFSILGMIFVEHKKPVRIIAWSLALFVFPFVGLLCYILIGYGLGISTKQMLRKREIHNHRYNESLQKQISLLKHNEEQLLVDENYKDLIMLNLKNANAIYTKDNSIKYFFFGQNMFEELKKDLLSATKTINIAFYIFANDVIGKEIRNILIKKASEGVRVKVLYDSIGSFFTHRRQFKKLKQAGGEIQEFFPPLLGIKLFNFKANYRNHRKIVVIDGKIGYIGGLNIRDDHLGKKKRLSPWKDCHIKVQGSSVSSLQNIFLSDWQFSCKNPKDNQEYLNSDYFSSEQNNGKSCMQIITSAPTESYNKNIEQLMLKMIYLAKESITIETPYFILDDEFKMALKMALLCGVKVKIVIPQKPDRKLVYYATLSYIKEILSLGAEVYLYKGFLHSKTLCVDNEILTLGSSNIDIRSFSLNFEANAVIYGSEDVKPYTTEFKNTLTESVKIDKEYFEKISITKKMMMNLSKLFSAIL